MTGKRVYYGHPFETVNAVEKKERLENLLACRGFSAQSSKSFFDEEKINAVLLTSETYKKAFCVHQYQIYKKNQQFVLFLVEE
jgi:hypothetical protein